MTAMQALDVMTWLCVGAFGVLFVLVLAYIASEDHSATGRTGTSSGKDAP
jgi:hypothetical protein